MIKAAMQKCYKTVIAYILEFKRPVSIHYGTLALVLSQLTQLKDSTNKFRNVDLCLDMT